MRSKKPMTPGSRFGRIASCALGFALLAIVPGAAEDQHLKWDGSRTAPVHRIPLKDELNQQIFPADSYPLPFSNRFSCAPCHDYDQIRQGLHFNAGDAKVPAGRPGEPWIWADEKTGTMIPMSYRKWPGVWNPEALGLTPWDFTLLFGRHLTGGGISEPLSKDKETPESRWDVSGRLEINCLGCHDASRRQDHSEWAKQVMRQNFRWAATAAAGLGEVGGIASRLPGTWDLFDGPNPDDQEWAVVPAVKYAAGLFDGKNQVYLDIVNKPGDANCLACHSEAPVGAKKADFDPDVHTAAGLKCVECHRNGISHDMNRGDTGDLTCAACHVGEKAEKGGKGFSGRLGAPFPRHNGFPKVHFERLSCTVCHSGPLPEKEAVRVRTSRANRLGVFGVARWATDLPAILEPVFVRGRDEKLAPNRLIWPSFWADLRSGKAVPLKAERVLAEAGTILDPGSMAAGILTAFYNVPDIGGTPLLVTAGRVYELNADGGLDVSVPEGGEASSSELSWAVRKEGKIISLIPDFDPASTEPNPDAENRVLQVLTALAAAPGKAGEPVFQSKKTFFRIKDGALDKSETSEPVPAPRLAWFKDGKAEPIIPDFARRAIVALTGTDKTLTEEQVTMVLEKLGKGCAYISGGRLFKLNGKGALEARRDRSAEAVTWPLAHEVRPARMALGANGCTDCHSAGSKFLFGSVKGNGPLRSSRVEKRAAISFMGMGRPYHFLFGLSFAVRPAFKLVLLGCALIVGSLLLIAILVGLGRFSGLIEKRR
jgi:hypothetical protein